ncbi:hypothetical protein [Pseudomonas fragariae (ex Marin et al. 2024)]|uniref:hypothetical protein n=1 Tax=Pseudomonas fragariae (ex Marin et al. 2024) TaxID=3080056 RepID=UPI003F792453
MSNDKMREEFEAWVLSEFPNQHMGKFADGEYHSTTLHYCWMAWQAAREALVIERPEKCEFAELDGPYHKGYRQGVRNMVDAIEAAGVKVKP